MIKASECFCGCQRQPEGSAQLASNLLGWEMNEQISELMKNSVLLGAMNPDRDLTNQERFLDDGRRYWLTLQAESHGEILPSRASKKEAKRWVKFSKKMWKKSPGRSMMEAMDFPESSAAEISAWLLEGTNPAWADEAEEAARRARE
ncbi:MAG: hypothetical protein WBQ41_09730 [Solirubrobacterales bacterium]